MTTLQKQKQEKKQNLINSAYELFMKKGINKTSVDEIVAKANVAKGTFYLYFKDKSDVMQEIVYRISYSVLMEAYEFAKAREEDDFADNVILMIDYIIEYFKKNKLVLKLIQKNFSWPLIQEKMSNPNDERSLDGLFKECINNPYMQIYSPDDAFKIIFSIIEMIGSVCYESIINRQPSDIDEMKPILYTIIRKIIR